VKVLFVVLLAALSGSRKIQDIAGKVIPDASPVRMMEPLESGEEALALADRALGFCVGIGLLSRGEKEKLGAQLVAFQGRMNSTVGTDRTPKDKMVSCDNSRCSMEFDLGWSGKDLKLYGIRISGMGKEGGLGNETRALPLVRSFFDFATHEKFFEKNKSFVRAGNLRSSFARFRGEETFSLKWDWGAARVSLGFEDQGCHWTLSYLEVAGFNPRPLDMGQAAPPFVLEGIDGKEYGLGEKSDALVVVNFWATWCAPCIWSLPHIQKAWKEYRGRGVQFYLVVLDPENADQIRTLMAEYGLSMPILQDDGVVSKEYGVLSVPRTFVIGTSGIVHHVQVGDPIWVERGLDETIRGLLGEI